MIAALALAVAAVLAPALAPVRAAPADVALVFVAGDAWETPDAAVGALVTVTARDEPCDVDVALTIGAGRRAALPGTGCSPVDWPSVVAANDARRHGAVVGALASVLAARGACVSGRGLGAVVATDREGAVAPGPCAAHVADLRSLPRADALAEARTLGREVLVVSLAERGSLGGVALLGSRGVLRGSTRRDGLVTLADLHAHLLGTRRLSVVPGSVSDVRELVVRERLHRPYHGIFYTGVIALPLLLYIWLAFGRRRAGPRARAVALALGALPVAGFLASLLPWWRPSWPAAAAVASVLLAVAAVAGAAVLLARRRGVPAEVAVAAVTAVVLLADVVTGGHLQETGIGSYSAVAGGRFHGLGNAAFAVLATACVVALGAAAARWGARAWLGLVPVVVVVAAPFWGADFGGAVTLTAVLVVALASRARSVVLGAAAGLLVALVASLADYARPAVERTHLGRFVGELVDGGWSDTLARKGSAALGSLLTFYPLLVAGSAVMAYVLLRRTRLPAALVRALVALWVVGSLVNDSGVVVAAAGMAVAVPLLVSYAERP